MTGRLARQRRLARAALWFEALWPALWPALGLAGAFVCAALLGLPALLPPAGRLLLLAATLLGSGALLWRELRRALSRNRAAWDAVGREAAGRAIADRRLERASGLRHRPLAVLADRPAGGPTAAGTARGAPADAVTQSLWEAHRARAAASIGRIRVGWPHPGLAGRDRRGMRGLLVVALVACLVIAGADAPARLAAALAPGFANAVGPATELAAWITPPGYTGLAPRLLRPGEGIVAVPAGSRLTVNVSGGTGRPALRLDGRRVPFRALDRGSFQAEETLSAGGNLAVRRGGRTLAAWTLRLLPDLPPTAAWAAPPGPLPADPLQTRLPWRVTDDYGVVALTAELRLRDRPDAPPLILALPLPEATKAATGSEVRDLTANPWAGLAVIARLVARDGAGQTARSGPAAFVLPQRIFHSPIARALIATRRDLSLRPADRAGALAALGRVPAGPDLDPGPAGPGGTGATRGWDPGGLAVLGAIAGALAHETSAATVPRVQELLWRLALHIENGTLDRTARALERARRAVRKALAEAMRTPNATTREALAERLRALEQAIQSRLRDLARQAARGAPLPPEAGNRLAARRMQQLAAAAQRAAERGDMNAAEQRLAQLEQMLDALRSVRALSAAEQRAAAAYQRAQKQMGGLERMIQREGRLLDHAYQRQQAEASRATAAPPEDGPPGSAAAQREADRKEQEALRRDLDRLREQLAQLIGQQPPSLAKAGDAMDAAGKALGAGRDPAAETAERQAIAALQKGRQETGQALAQHFGGQGTGQGARGQGRGQGGLGLASPGSEATDGGGGENEMGGEGNGADGTGRDPLGRRFGAGGEGGAATNGVRLPDAPQPRRIEEILRELRRRAAEQSRPPEERDYIDRLLKRF